MPRLTEMMARGVWCLFLGTALALGTVLASSTALAGDVNWERQQLDARFRSEGAAAGDFNKDGKLDIVAGDYWYEAPNWERHEFRKAGDFWAGVGYSNSFCNWTYDINGDGWMDIIVVGFPGEKFHWYENPKNQPGPWAEHVIWDSICNETPQFLDLTGDGKPEVVCGSQPQSQMGYLEIPSPDKAAEKWTFVPISTPGDPNKNGTFKYYHGLGVTDIDGDGRKDVVIGHGYWKHPETIKPGEPWEFHAHELGQAGADIYAEDLDLDGDNDLLMSSAHQFGVWWFENKGAQPDGSTKFETHLIDKSFSQTHAMHYVDINGDGQKDLLTGKRYYAHNGGDPGANEPVVMNWFEIKKTKGAAPEFIKHEIPAGRDTGVGTQFSVLDMNGDGKLDVVLSNKKGVNLLLQIP